MRTGLVIAFLLLGMTLAGSWYTSGEILQVSERYVSAAEELLYMAEAGAWARAEETAGAYLESWEQTVPRLQMLINHDDTDSVTLSLRRLEAAIRAQDAAGCLTACAELRENAEHLYHRDAFTLANVL